MLFTGLKQVLAQRPVEKSGREVAAVHVDKGPVGG